MFWEAWRWWIKWWGCWSRVHWLSIERGTCWRSAQYGSADETSWTIYARTGRIASAKSSRLKKQQELGSFCLAKPGSKVHVPRHDRTVKARVWNEPLKMKMCVFVLHAHKAQSTNTNRAKARAQSKGITNFHTRVASKHFECSQPLQSKPFLTN